MIDLCRVEIFSERLRLSPISEEYATEIFQEFDYEITRYMDPKPPNQLAETEEFIQFALEGQKMGLHLQLIIFERTTQQFLGLTGLHDMDKEIPEVGIWIKKEAHGNHYGREAIAALVQWAQKNLDCDFLSYPVDRRNIPSVKIPESLNGEIIQEYKDWSQSKRPLDIIVFHIPLRTE